MTDGFLIDAGGASPYQTTEHYLRRVLAGDLKSVRTRIIAALERLSYDIIDDGEAAIRGRRAATGWGTFYSSADVLDYPRTLVIKLKPAGEHSTRVTYDYLIKHPSLSTGEKDILTREAEAISSLATVRSREKHCAACGTESTDDSRFCRRCGSPMAANNSELELLNMAAEVRSGLTSVTAGEIGASAVAILSGAAVITILAKGIVLGPGIMVLLATSFVIAMMTAVVLGFGINRCMRSLKRPDAEKGGYANITSFPVETDKYLPESNQPYVSVTESTTSLLDVPRERQTLSDLDEQEITFEGRR
ncbi:MAG: zinc ribbon domain-containing protein [Pyrinomonadaceae bacterium]|nr:zinc ribbon domain-containing protein [Pyrinomonadaceae bacterium]MBP6212789.1 zinc ribbon domain-containing protein [Pyrinomonadaceae bacterium]